MIGNPQSSLSLIPNLPPHLLLHFTQLPMHFLTQDKKRGIRWFTMVLAVAARAVQLLQIKALHWSDMEPSDLTRTNVNLRVLREVAMIFDKLWKPVFMSATASRKHLLQTMWVGVP